MNLVEDEHYRISLDTSVPCLEWIGLKPMDSDTFRESEVHLKDHYLKAVKKHSGLQMFVDARVIGLISAADTTWVANEILPPISAAGLKKEAFIVPESALEKLIVRNFKSKAGDIVEIKVFTDEKEAKYWLQE